MCSKRIVHMHVSKDRCSCSIYHSPCAKSTRMSAWVWSAVVLMVRLDPRFCVWAMLFSANRASSLRSLKVKLVALVIYRAYGSSRTVLGSPNDFRESVLLNGSFQRAGSINGFFCSLRHSRVPYHLGEALCTTNFKSVNCSLCIAPFDEAMIQLRRLCWNSFCIFK